MEYSVRVWSAMDGDVVPLISVATAMARYAATGYGTLPLHGPTQKTLRPERAQLLLDAARHGQLKVCDSQGRAPSAGNLVETAEALAKELFGAIQAEAMNAETIVPFLYARRQHLIEWGKACGDVFLFVETPGTLVESDLRDFLCDPNGPGYGAVIEAGYNRGFFGGGESEPWSDYDTGISKPSDTLGLPEFEACARPCRVPPELLELKPDTRVFVFESIGSFSGSGTWLVSQYIAAIEARIARQSSGFFTVDEAVQILKNVHPDIDIRQMIDRIRGASVAERALVRDHRDRLPLRPNSAFRSWADLVQIDDLNQWLDGQRVGYGFPANAPTQNTATPVEEIDYSLLATPTQLLDAFGKWGMDAAWFDDLNSRQWLLDARRRKGQGQRGHVIEPLFCPFAVMNGLIEKVRKATRMQPDTAWRTLEHKFPNVYSTVEQFDPRERTGH